MYNVTIDFNDGTALHVNTKEILTEKDLEKQFISFIDEDGEASYIKFDTIKVMTFTPEV